jgi:hypothetical protein
LTRIVCVRREDEATHLVMGGDGYALRVLAAIWQLRVLARLVELADGRTCAFYDDDECNVYLTYNEPPSEAVASAARKGIQILTHGLIFVAIQDGTGWEEALQIFQYDEVGESVHIVWQPGGAVALQQYDKLRVYRGGT